MGLRERLAQWLRPSGKALVDSAPYMLLRTGAGEQYNMPDYTLAEAHGELYQRLSWVQIAVSAVAKGASPTPLRVKRLVGEKRENVENHPFELLLQKPNPLQSRYEFLEATFSYRALGNAYWWLNRRSPDAPPTELWILPSRQVRPVPDGRMFLAGYEYDPMDGGKPELLPPWQVAHFKLYNPGSWFTGLSPIEALATVAEGDMAMQRWNTNLFAKNNAKFPGVLAFSDWVENSEWERIREEIPREYGGTKRSLMMMRGAGKGGVQWIPTAMSQSDMEFLAGRGATKEEIFAMIAPGLASILAINATEANSTAGRSTLMDLTVYPATVAVAEKITNDILPAYGAGLVCEFDDVRITDKAMELAERQSFAAVHTIDEVRERFFEAPPIGDERGRMLVAEITAGNALPGPAIESSAVVQDGDQGAPDAPDMPDAPDDNDDAAMAKARRREVQKLLRWARKHDNPDPARFKSTILSDTDKRAILAWESAEVGGAADAPFPVAGWEHYP